MRLRRVRVHGSGFMPHGISVGTFGEARFFGDVLTVALMVILTDDRDVVPS